MGGKRRRPKLSVIVPVYNEADHLLQALNAVKDSEFADFELIVVDDYSTDGSDSISAKYADTFVRLDKNMGPAHARNEGAKKALGEILVFVDADVKIKPTTLGRISDIFEKDSNLSAIFGSYDDSPAGKGFFSQYKDLFHHYIHQNSSTEAKTFWTGLGAIRKEQFIQVNGFPPIHGIEDVMLGYKLSKHHKIHVLKDLQAKHLKQWSFFKILSTDIILRSRHWTKLAWDDGLPNDLNFKTSDRLSALLSLMLFFSLVSTVIHPRLSMIALPPALTLILLNCKLYVFFLKKRGLFFMARAILFHWFYLIYASSSFAFFSAILFAKKIFSK